MKKIISIIIIILLSVADIFLFRIGVLPGEPSITIIPLLFLLVVLNKKYVTNMQYANKNTVFFFVGLFLLSILLSPVSTYDKIYTSIGLYALSLIIYLLAFGFFKSQDIKKVRFIFLSAITILFLSMLYDLFFRSSFVSRGAGFAENPNSAALRINFMIIALLFTIENRIYKNIVLIAGLLMVFLTLSRSGMLLYLVILILSISNANNTMFSIKRLKNKVVKSVFVLSLFGVVFYSLIGVLVKIIPAFQTSTVENRIDQITGKETIINDLDQGQGGRLKLAMEYLDLFVDEPLGYGTGMSNNRDFFHASTHNVYLRVLIDFGILGLLLYLFFIIKGVRLSLKYKNLYYIMFFLIVIICSIFTNTLLEDRTFIIVLACLDVLILKNNYKSI